MNKPNNNSTSRRPRKSLLDFKRKTDEERLAVIKDNYLYLVIYEGGNDYQIGLSRLDTPLKMLNQIKHLSEKPQFTREVCRDLIDVVSEHFGWDSRLPQ